FDEYGNPATTLPATGAGTRYGWHGADQRATNPTSGLILMGARLYNPATGLFTTRGPIAGGNTTTYAYPQDPINQEDTSGLWGKKAWRFAKKAWKNPWVQVGVTVGLAFIPGGLAIRVGLGILSKSARINSALRASSMVRRSPIRSMSRHGLNQSINRKISPQNLRSAVVHPIAMKPQLRKTVYFGARASVVLNSERRLVTVWRNSLWRKKK
ncbi:RHS repeat-associated core domain-containing protein, partial [Zhihengliuella sp.]|uniref:RHS repeat-associated core domain-containing protein n=1 Tax=Zhihengliuella sp. TaxID=1954483 RepID=UPI0028115430